MYRLVVSLTFTLAFLSATSFIQAQVPQPSGGSHDYSKQAYIIEQTVDKSTFSADGTSVRDGRARIRLQSDAAVQRWGLLQFGYQSLSGTVDIDYVRVQKPDGSVVVTTLENVQDMPAPITQQAPFYSDLREKHVAVKGLAVGDVLEYEAHWRVNRPLIPGKFWVDLSLNDDEIVLDQQLEVRVPRNSQINIKSPLLKPLVTEDGEYRVYQWKTAHLEPKPDEDKQEKEHNAVLAALGHSPRADIQVSNFRTWDEVGRWYEDLQKDRVRPTPQIQAKAAELTKGLTDETAKIRAIYNFVSLQFRYIGVAFGIGRYQPHAADDVMSNQYGDCKDKHTLFAALLQAAGIKAFPALIGTQHEIDPDVPSPGQFDHVITAVPQGAGYLWLDTTPEVAPFGHLILPLRGKQALVIPPDSPAQLAKTPSELVSPESEDFTIRAKVDNSGSLEGKIERTISGGDSEILLRAAFRSLGMQQWKDLTQQLSYGLGFAGDVSDVAVNPPEQTSSPLHITYTYKRKDYPDWPNKRISVPEPPFGVPEIADEPSKMKYPLWLGPIKTFHVHSEVELPSGYFPQLPKTVNISIESAEFHATYSLKGAILIADKTLTIKKQEVTTAEYKEYKSLRKSIDDDLNQYVVLSFGKGVPVSPGNTLQPALNAFIKLQQEVFALPDTTVPGAAEAYNTARDAFQQGTPLTAIKELERSVSEDPKFARAWVLLGQTRLQMGQTEQGLEAMRKATYAEPDKGIVYKALGFQLMTLRRLDEAISVWKKFIEIDPDDGDGPDNLALVYSELKKYADAIPLLESRVQAQPENTGYRMQLASAYLRTGDEQKSMAIYDQLLKVSDGQSTKNDIAYELADANRRLPDALKYSREAVQEEEEASQKIRLSELKEEDLAHSPKLASYWDTLGWVYFRLGQLQNAESYLSAGWALSQNGTIAEHLGEVYEAQHRKADALRIYRLAISAGGPASIVNASRKAQERLERLSGATPPPAPKGILVRDSFTGGGELSMMRTVKLDRVVTGTANAEFFLLFSPDSKLEDAKFVSGSERLKNAGKLLLTRKFNVPFPTGSSAHLLRRGILSCYQITGCSFVMFSPQDVKSTN